MFRKKAGKPWFQKKAAEEFEAEEPELRKWFDQLPAIKTLSMPVRAANRRLEENKHVVIIVLRKQWLISRLR